MLESIDQITKNVNNLLRENTNEEKYKILFNIFVHNILQDNAEKFLDHTIIGIYRDKIIDMFFDYKGVSDIIDNLDKCAFDFVKEVIEKRPEYFFEIK
jgi:hypothetical protein